MEPLPTIIIALVSAVIGGLLRPWGQDWVARRAEGRAERRARAAESKARLELVIECLTAPSPTALAQSSAALRAYRGLPAAASAVGDDLLTRWADEMQEARIGSPPWLAAQKAALNRAGALLSVVSY